jgi:hypothetical protein
LCEAFLLEWIREKANPIIAHQFRKIAGSDFMPGDQHVIMPGQWLRRQPHRFAQAPLGTVAHHGTAEFFGGGEAEAYVRRVSPDARPDAGAIAQ